MNMLPAPPASAPELAALSDRADKAERELEDLRVSLAPSGVVATPMFDVDSMVVATQAKVHLLPHGALEWPRPLWATLYGWRWGSSSTQVAIVSEERSSKWDRELCGKCIRIRAKGRGQNVGGIECLDD